MPRPDSLKRRPARPVTVVRPSWPEEDQRCFERLLERMGPRDRRAAIVIVSRVGEVAAQQGQAAALKLVEEIIGIVKRPEFEG